MIHQIFRLPITLRSILFLKGIGLFFVDHHLALGNPRMLIQAPGQREGRQTG